MTVPTPMLAVSNNPTAVTSKACAANFQATSAATTKFAPPQRRRYFQTPTPVKTRFPLSLCAPNCPVPCTAAPTNRCCERQRRINCTHVGRRNIKNTTIVFLVLNNVFNQTCHQSNRPRLQGCIPTAARWCIMHMRAAAAPPH
jgi:hypothetical protein